MNRLGCGVLASVCEPFYGEPSREETRMRARRLDGVMRSEVGNLVQPSQKGGMMNDSIVCKRCKELCQVDGEFPKFSAYCDNCEDYVDVDDYTADYLASGIDRAYERSRWEER